MTAHNEERALDALIAITLRAGLHNEITEAEIDEHMANPQLNQEELKAYDEWKKTSLARALGKLDGAKPKPSAVEQVEYAAMNRKNEAEKHDAATEEELERLRKKLLGGEEKQK
ncbi:MAG: hypothetical protein KJ626_16535 [Verrucomicrobia bacterium]|nr:hypothetical protein [Verrucomicrobiota bacterium]